MVAQRLSWLKPAVAAGGLLPLAAIVYRWASGDLGANPIAEVLNRLGLLALILLVLSLACTPIKLVFGHNWPLRVRRMLGLLSFFYACLHVLVYAFLDQFMDLRAIVADIARRPFILVGALSFLGMVPLAVTSTKQMVQRLGARRWKRLHRLSYVVAGLAVVHFVLRVKQDTTEPLMYGAVLVVLLLVRVADALAARYRGAEAR